MRWGGRVKVGKAVLNHVQTKILGEETMSEQKQLTHAVGPRGVPRRPPERRATNSSFQGPESFWSHPTAPASRRCRPVLFPVLGIMWNCEFLCVIDLNRTLWNFMVFYLCFCGFTREEGMVCWKFGFRFSGMEMEVKKIKKGRSSVICGNFQREAFAPCSLWSTSLPQVDSVVE